MECTTYCNDLYIRVDAGMIVNPMPVAMEAVELRYLIELTT